jgi:threonine/homoserine/homoserine lactone efflux protein
MSGVSVVDATLITYTTATAIFAITPGQSTTVVIQQTVDNGWRAGLAAAIGCAIANVAHATAAGIGLAVLVRHAPMVLDGIRWCGGAYLIWLGGHSLWRARTAAAAIRREPPSQSRHLALSQGLVTNLLNPSILTFYLVVVPTFMPAGSGASRYLLLAAIHVSLAFASHNLWAGLFNQIGHLMRNLTARRVFDALAGSALLYLAVRVFTG